MRLEGNVVLVTGGTRGIGQGVVQMLASIELGSVRLLDNLGLEIPEA